MPRSKAYSATSALRHRAKMERILMGHISETTAMALASAINSEWDRKFGVYNDAYRKLKEYLASAHPEVPKGQYGFYRSFLFKAMKEIPAGHSPDDIIETFQKKVGLDPNVMRDILEYFGLATERAPEETVTKKG